jgi:small-conductance mechanosensitive channel
LSIVIENQIDYRSNNNSNIIDGKSIIVNEDARKRSSSGKACFCVPLLRNKCFALPFVLFILVLTLGMLIFVLIKGKNHISYLENKLRIKENFNAEAKNQSNQTVEQSNKRLLEQQETIKQLNKNITELNKQNNQTMEQSNKRLFEQQETIKQLNKQNNQTMEQLNKRLLEQQETIKQLNKNITQLNKQNNQTIKQLNDDLLQNNVTIEHLNKTFIQFKTERSRINSYLK